MNSSNVASSFGIAKTRIHSFSARISFSFSTVMSDIYFVADFNDAGEIPLSSAEHLCGIPFHTIYSKNIQ